MKRYRLTGNGGSLLCYGNEQRTMFYFMNGLHYTIKSNLFDYIKENENYVNFGEDNFSLEEI